MAILTWLTLWLAALVVSVILGPVVRVAHSLQCAHGVQSLSFCEVEVCCSFCPLLAPPRGAGVVTALYMAAASLHASQCATAYVTESPSTRCCCTFFGLINNAMYCVCLFQQSWKTLLAQLCCQLIASSLWSSSSCTVGWRHEAPQHQWPLKSVACVQSSMHTL